MTEEKPEVRIPCPKKCKSPKCKANIRKKHLDYTKKPIVWILGGPASGKRTQCEKIVAKYGFLYLSTADLVRNEVHVSHHAIYLADILSHGCLAPNELILDLLKERMEAGYDKCKGFIIDGFPKEWRQGPEFEKHIASPAVVIYLDTSHETMTQRMKDRDKTSLESVPEGFEEEESIQVKIRTHMENEGPILKHYEEQNKLRVINAEQTEEEVFLDVQEVLDPLVPRLVRTASNATVKSVRPGPS